MDPNNTNPYQQPSVPQPQVLPQPSQPPQPTNQFVLPSNLVLEARMGIFSIMGNGGLICIALPTNVSLKENLDVFYDQARTQPFFYIRERKVVGISQTFDVLTVNNQPIVSFQHNGLSSIIRESWLVLDSYGTNIGSIEQSLLAGISGRFLLKSLTPQKFMMTLNGQATAEFKEKGSIHHFNTAINFLSNNANSQYAVLVLSAAFLLANRRTSKAENGPIGI